MFSQRQRTGGIDEIPLPWSASWPAHLSPAAGGATDSGGRLWLCGKHHIAPDPEAVMAALGAQVVVCLNHRHELDGHFPHYVDWLLEQRSAGRSVWFPIPDLGMLSMREMRHLFDDVAQRLRSGDGVIVHCAAGIGRSGTTAVAVLMLLGVERDQALTVVRSHRPMAGPEVGAQVDLIDQLNAELTHDRGR